MGGPTQSSLYAPRKKAKMSRAQDLTARASTESCPDQRPRGLRFFTVLRPLGPTDMAPISLRQGHPVREKPIKGVNQGGGERISPNIGMHRLEGVLTLPRKPAGEEDSIRLQPNPATAPGCPPAVSTSANKPAKCRLLSFHRPAEQALWGESQSTNREPMQPSVMVCNGRRGAHHSTSSKGVRIRAHTPLEVAVERFAAGTELGSGGTHGPIGAVEEQTNHEDHRDTPAVATNQQGSNTLGSSGCAKQQSGATSGDGRDAAIRQGMIFAYHFECRISGVSHGL